MKEMGEEQIRKHMTLASGERADDLVEDDPLTTSQACSEEVASSR